MDEHQLPDEAEHYEAREEGEAPIEEQPAAPAPTPVATAPEQHKAAPQSTTQSNWQKIVIFYSQCVRVFKITKKPDRQEFITVTKIAGVGILIIGAIGFLVHLLGQFFT